MLRATSTSSTSSPRGGFISEDEKKEHFIESYASTIALKSMLEDNEDAKMRALRVNLQPLSELGSAKSANFYSAMRPFARNRAEIGRHEREFAVCYLALLIAWLSDCALAVLVRHLGCVASSNLEDLAKYSSLKTFGLSHACV